LLRSPASQEMTQLMRSGKLAGHQLSGSPEMVGKL
jgi:hypothetical protein